MIRRVAVIAAAVCSLLAAPRAASAADAATLFRVFLKDGSTLVSFGEVARVGDRAVFSIRTGTGPDAPLQLVDLAADLVNWPRTDQYAYSARADHYLATRAEDDYAVLANDVATTLNAIAFAPDAASRLKIVESARRTLADWPRTHYNFRAADVRQMLGMLDDAIADLHASNGDGTFDLKLSAYAGAPPVVEPVQSPPTLQESIAQVLVAARLSDVPVERESLLSAAIDRLDARADALPAEWVETTRRQAGNMLDRERTLDRSYQAVVDDYAPRARTAARRADVRGLEWILTRVRQRDAALGHERPAVVEALIADVSAQLDAARRLQLMRDRWTLRLPTYRSYTSRMKLPLALLTQVDKALEDIKDLAGTPPARLVSVEKQVDQIRELVASVTPPQELVGAHALLLSAANLAGNAARIRHEATLSGDMTRAWDASSAAAGALMLGGQARTRDPGDARAATAPVITPRRTRLVRVPDLQTFRRLTTRLALAEDPPAGARLVVVPNRSAARQLRRTHPDAPWPDLVTRDQFYDRLQSRLSPPPGRLTPYAREAAIRAASRVAAESGVEPPFALRPGLVAEMLRFYDQLRRQRQSVDRFEELIVESLSGNPDDRGAERMLRQTRFLAAAFRAYQDRLERAGALDEHGLRERLVATASPDPVRHVVITVGDWIADPDGLFVADFDLLTRLPGLEAIDIVTTTGTLASGFHQRVHDWLPGLSEADAEAFGVAGPWEAPVWSVPAADEPSLAFVRRDREEELVAVARRAATDPAPAAVAFRRPLPYLYLAGKVFTDAGVAYQTHDALPLASEPFVAAVDLVAEFVLSSFARPAAVALLRSPHFEWSRPGRQVTRAAVAALDRVLSESRYLGEIDRLRQIAADGEDESADRHALFETARPACHAVLEAAEELAPLRDAAPLSVHLDRFSRFLDAHVTPVDDRQARARATLAGVLRDLGAAYAEHGDPDSTIDAVVAELRRWIEEETFVPESGDAGLQLVDAQAARYAAVADLFVVGLIQGEWPERQRRNIFYPPGLLAALGWPSEADRRGAELAAFVDLLRSPTRRLELSTFTLDDEALVEPSALVEEAPGAGLGVEVRPILTSARLFEEERLSIAPPVLDGLDGPPRTWAELRLGRTASADPRYHGEAGGQEPRPVSVSALETYLQCPFKYYARHVLRLEEEPDDEEVMDPRRQGQLVHAVFENFFEEWDRAGRGAITPETLDEAHTLFERIVEPHLARLSETEAAIERTRFLGSSVAPGLADAVFRMEAERPVPVKERRLEYPLKGPFVFQGPSGERTVEVRGVADRVDLLADGTFRLIDYKLSTAPSKSRALQLPIYGLCAEQTLGGRWTLGEAAYVTFRGPRRVVPLFTARSDRDKVLAEAQERFLTAVDGVEAGHFPPTPTDVFLCSFCSYGAVCRKDYVGDVG